MQTSARFHFQACAKSLIFKGNNNEILEKEKKKNTILKGIPRRESGRFRSSGKEIYRIVKLDFFKCEAFCCLCKLRKFNFCFGFFFF